MYTGYGYPDTVCSNDKVYNTFASNPDVTPATAAPAALNQNTELTGQVPAKGLSPGTLWFVDQSLPDNYLYYFNKNAIWMIQEPFRTSNYRDEFPGQSGVLLRDWHHRGIWQEGSPQF